VSGLRRREKSESAARLASLEEHVVKMHAASWSLQKVRVRARVRVRVWVWVWVRGSSSYP